MGYDVCSGEARSALALDCKLRGTLKNDDFLPREFYLNSSGSLMAAATVKVFLKNLGGAMPVYPSRLGTRAEHGRAKDACVIS
jgi:hypothetical protein